MLHFIDVFRRVYCRVSYILSAAIIVFMTCLQFFQIFYRYICGHVFIGVMLCVTILLSLIERILKYHKEA